MIQLVFLELLEFELVIQQEDYIDHNEFVVIRWAVSLFKLEDEVKVQVEWC